jgi:hypothetical protein
LPRALDAALNAIIPSLLLFLEVETIVAEIASMEVLIRVSSKSSKLSASFRVLGVNSDSEFDILLQFYY